MKRKSHHEEPENHERWLLTYVDLITLLLGLFVILYAMSKIDSAKYAQLITALSGVFGGSQASIVNGGSGVIDLPASMLKTERELIGDKLKKAFRNQLGDGPVFITNEERGLTVHILEELLFASGNAEFKQNSLAILDTLASVLKTVPNDLRVEGHTDNVPISTQLFPSNWHLSVERAVNAGFYLIEKHGLAPARVSVVGFSEYHPLVPNTSNENRARNRRVDIVIITSAAHSQTIVEGDKEAPPSLTK